MTKRPVLLIVIALNLLVLVALAFAYPHLMVSPGPLVKGHAQLTTDCFACHVPLRGAASAQCIGCHATADIGLRTTTGVPIAVGSTKAAFHQQLAAQDCMACHSDHQGPKLTQRSRKPFSHGMLKPAVQQRCASCHAAPQDNVHRDLKVACSQCHQSDAWQPAHFDHAVLATDARGRCETCHNAPTDRLHRQITGSCQSCHQTTAWTPATFDHAKYFVLDRDHDAPCETCHKSNVYSQSTCYGCHAHSQAKVRAEHLEEGIQDIAHCVECHRDPGVEPEKRGRGGDVGQRGKGERD